MHLLLFMLRTYFFCKITIFRRHAMSFVTKITPSVKQICSFIEKIILLKTKSTHIMEFHRQVQLHISQINMSKNTQ